MSASADAGVIGMAVMGRNLAKNIESRGHTVAIYNRTWEKIEEVMAREHAQGARFVPCRELAEFVAAPLLLSFKGRVVEAPAAAADAPGSPPPA